VGEPESLNAARVVVAFTHGFVDMELAGASRLGSNIEKAFELGIKNLIEILHRLKNCS
jgi:hypothetical protein